LDAVNDALLHGATIPKKSRLEAAKWIAARQGLPGAYAGLFAPTEKDFRKGIRLFTGEKLGTRAGIAHILGEEAARALILLGTPHPNERAALERASMGMVRRLQEHERPESGRYCCGKCTCALWRHLSVGGLRGVDAERWIEAGMKVLKSLRNGKGRWNVFPFYYTLLTLSDLDSLSAMAEMRYAAHLCERLLKRQTRDGCVETRRRIVMRRVLDKC
jgi:hypothetical protein